MREEKSGQRKENGPSSEIKSEQKKTEKIDGKNSEKDGWRKKMPRGRVVAGALALVLFTGGSVVLWKEYQAGALFHPEYFLSRQELRGNQISFADSDRYAKNNLPEKDSSDNEMLEKDPQAQEKTGQEMEDVSPRVTMDESQKQTGDAGNLLLEQMPEAGTADASDRGLSDFENSGAMMLVAGGGDNGQSEHVSIGNVAGGLTDGNSQNPTGTAGSIVSGKADSERENGSFSSGGGGSNGGGENSGNGGDNPSVPDHSDNQTPSNPDTPSPSPTPTPDKPGNNPTEGKDSNLSDPDYPDSSEKPQLPKDPSWSGDSAIYPSFPDTGIISDERAQDAQLILIPCIDDSAETLYQGAVLTKWKLLCSLYAYVDVGGTRYRLTDYNDNFRIGEFPETATKDMTVTFYFRGNANCPWQEVSYTFPVEYSKLVMMGMPDEDGSREVLDTIYPDEGSEIYLPNETMKLAGAENWESFGDWMTELFPQWSLTEGGEDIGSYFKVDKPGRYVFYPLSRTPLPDEFYGVFDVNEDRTTGSLFLEQKLTFWPSKQERFEIPQGIQGVEQDMFFIADDVAETAWIPESVQFIDSPAFEVKKEYQVSEKNRYFTVKDGMLFDKLKKELIGIPLECESVEVPKDIEVVSLSSKNSIHEMTFLSATPPEINLSCLNNATLIVPESAYGRYLFAWGSELGMNHLETGGEEEPDYDYRDGALFSKDGKKLYQVSKENSGLYFVPDGVESVVSQAFEVSEYIDRVFLPESLQKLESESLSGESLTELFFASEAPPEIEKDTFGEIETVLERGLHVRVAEGNRDAYLEAWGPILGEEQAERLIVDEPFDLVEKESGLSYLNLPDGAVLFQAPEDLTSFDDIVAEAGEEVVWKEIGVRAFGTCESLETIELPETIEKIAKEAFVQCKNLQIAVCKTKETIEVGKNAFPTIRAVAFDALEVKFAEDEENMIYTSCYVNNDCEVSGGRMPYLVNLWGTSYELMDSDQSGRFLYGMDGDVSYLIGGTTDVSGEIVAPEGTILREIGYYALENCEGDLTISEEYSRGLWFVGPGAFRNSGLSGTVAFSEAVWRIEENAFAGCSGVTEIRFDAEPDEPVDETPLVIGDQAFANTSIEEICFPHTLSTLGQYAFLQCLNLERVVFTSEEAPTLVTFSRGSQYMFGWEDDENEVAITLEDTAEGCEQEYIDKWKLSMFGYLSKEEMAQDMSFNLMIDVMFDWPGEIWGDDGEYTPEFSAYFDDYVDVKVDQKLYETEVLLSEMMGIDPPEEPDWVFPNPDDYLTDSTEEIENPDELIKEILPVNPIEEPVNPDDPTEEVDGEIDEIDKIGGNDEIEDTDEIKDSDADDKSDDKVNDKSDDKLDDKSEETKDDGSDEKVDHESGDNSGETKDDTADETGDSDVEDGRDGDDNETGEDADDSNSDIGSDLEDEKAGQEVENSGEDAKTAQDKETRETTEKIKETEKTEKTEGESQS